MAAVRFTSEFKTSLGLEYKIEIYDQDHTGSSTAFKLGAEGFTINWRGNNNDMFEPIVGSECGFTMMIEDATHEQFIVDIASSRENRFWIGIYKGANLWWCGIMASDIARVEDLDYPYAFEIRAYDGLGLLKNSNYAANKYEPIRGYERFTTIIERCLNYLPHIAHYYSGSTNFINTSINWYEDSHTYAQTYDPLYHTYANNDVTYSAADQASWNNAIYTYLSAYEVLANVMKVFGARIMHLEGRFVIEQLETRISNTFFSRRYAYPVGSPSAISLVDRASVKPSQSPARRKKAGTYFTWFPALKEVRVSYASLNRRNFWPPQNFSYAGSGPRAPETDTGFSISAGPGARFQFTCNITFNIPQYGWGSVISEGDNYYVVAKLLIKIVGSSSTRYLVRPIAGTSYGPTAWQGPPGTFDVKLPAFLALDSATFQPVTIQQPINVIAPPVDTDGTLSVNLSIEKIYGPDATNNLQFGEFDVANVFNFNYQVFNPVLTLQETTTNAITTIAENDDADNSAKYETEIIWADGDKPNTLGRLRTFDGSVYTDTDKWGVKTVSGTQTIQELLAERILRMQKTPIRKMYTTVYGADFPLYRNLLDSNDDEWCVLGVTYNSNVDEWQGEWFNIRINSGGTVIFETEEAEQYPGTNNPPGPYGDTSTESFPGTGFAPATLEPLAAAVVALSYPSGSPPGSGISVNSVLGANAFVQGQQIAIVNPSSGQFAYFEVTSDTAAGDTAIAISGSFPSRFPAGSYIINLPSNYTASGGVGPSQGGGGSKWLDDEFDPPTIYRESNVYISRNVTGETSFGIFALNASGDSVFDIAGSSDSVADQYMRFRRLADDAGWNFGRDNDGGLKIVQGNSLAASACVDIDASSQVSYFASIGGIENPPSVTLAAAAGDLAYISHLSGSDACFDFRYFISGSGVTSGLHATITLNKSYKNYPIPIIGTHGTGTLLGDYYASAHSPNEIGLYRQAGSIFSGQRRFYFHVLGF